jgi:DNA-binding NarL/FixJ family response regulator
MNISVLILDSDSVSRKKLNQVINDIETIDCSCPPSISIVNNDNFQEAINSINSLTIDIIFINISSIAIDKHIEECIQLKNIYSFAPIVAISETDSNRLDQYNYIGLDDILNINIISPSILLRVTTSAIQRYKNFNAFHSLNQKKLVSNQLLKLLLKKKSLTALATDACQIIHSQSLKSDSSTASIYLINNDEIERIAHVGTEESEEAIEESKRKLLQMKQSASTADDFEYFKIDPKTTLGKSTGSIAVDIDWSIINKKLDICLSRNIKLERFDVSYKRNGGGIPTVIQEKIFDPFFTTKEVGKGTGQGLPLSYRIIKDRHAGEMFFESTPGQGTTFVIKLPYQ